MNQEDKELLIKDLCARLPYGVRGKVTADTVVLHKYDMDGFPLETTFDVNVELQRIDTGNDEIFVSTFDNNEDLGNYIEECQTEGTPWTIEEFIPYLRSLYSMTEEEKTEIEKITNSSFHVNSIYGHIANFKSQTYGDWHGNWHTSSYNYPVTNVECNKLISWLDKKHFDHRTDEEGHTLIEKGLALESLEGIYK